MPEATDAPYTLTAVAAVSPSDVWVIETPKNGSNAAQMFEHWNGSGWDLVPTPNPSSMLRAITAISRDDIWAVGDGLQIVHWNGNRWTSVQDFPNEATFSGVSGSSRSDVWAVGADGVEPFIEHWNGKVWTAGRGAYVPDGGYLSSVFALSGTDAWAVGGGLAYNGKPFTEHWNGLAWSLVRVPLGLSSNQEYTGAWLTSVAATSSTSVWASGYRQPRKSPHRSRKLVLQWDGSSWNIVETPQLTRFAQAWSSINALAAVRGTATALAVGAWNSDSGGPLAGSAFVEAYECWR